MAEYQRLITYAYNYESGVKRHNVGHARVELIGSELKIKLDLKIPSLSGKNLKLYFYKRIRGGIQTVFLQELSVNSGGVSQRISRESKNIGDSGLNFDELQGFILYLNNSKCIVSDWRDISLTKEELSCVENPITKWVQKEAVQPVQEETPENKASIEIPVITDNNEAEESEEAIEDNNITESEEVIEDDSSIENEEIVTEQVESVDAAEVEAYDEESLDGSAEERVSATSLGMLKDGKETQFPWRDAPAARHILDSFPRVYPFEDGEIAECVKIEPKDIGLFPMETWAIGNNSFLIHAHCNYHHLLFAKKQTRGGSLYLLMVPGVYSPREKYMARMFGFEYFKCAKRRTVRDGEFGYWYVTINFGV